MSKENNLTDFLTDVADAIREKKGTTEKINPQNFSSEISSLKVGDSSNIEYWNIPDGAVLAEIGLFFSQMKYILKGDLYVASMVDYRSNFADIEVKACSLDKNVQMISDGEIKTVGEWLLELGLNDLTSIGWTQITKEEFYSLEVPAPTLKIQGIGVVNEDEGIYEPDIVNRDVIDNTYAEHNKALYNYIIANGITKDDEGNYPDLTIETLLYDNNSTVYTSRREYHYCDKEEDAQRRNYYEQYGDDCVVLNGYNDFSIEWIVLFSDGRVIVILGD